MAAPDVTSNVQTQSVPIGPLIGALIGCVSAVILIMLFVYLYAVKYRNKKQHDIEDNNKMFLNTITNPITKPGQVRHIRLGPGDRNPLQSVV